MNLSSSQQNKQIQTISQVLSPQIIQMLQTFSLPYSKLLEKVKNASEENMCLEITQEDQLLSFSTDKRTGSSTIDAKEMASDYKETLESFLLNQINDLYLKKKDTDILLYLISHLDSRGYLTNYSTIKPTILDKFTISERKLNQILSILHSFEPDGIGARDLKECLLIQVNHYDFENLTLKELLVTFIKNHLEILDTSTNELDIQTIARELSITPDGVLGLIEFIRNNLTPTPSNLFSESKNNIQTIIPSFDITYDNGRISIINLEEKYGVKISISKKYEQMLADPSTDSKTKQFINEKLTAAKQLKESLENRHKTLAALVRYTIDIQHNFILHGKLFLVPLLQKNVAASLNISTSTVSRMVTSKYIRTPHGIFPIKTLCPRNHFGKTSQQLTLIVKDIIKENPSYSDKEIKDILAKKYHIQIARRTINKYRHL